MSRQSLQSELQLYLREINEVPLLTPEEEKDLGWRIINDNDQDAKEQMIKANLRWSSASPRTTPTAGCRWWT